MPDREKVINAIECCIDGCLCAECDYEGIEGCWNKILLTDALALLKEQEAVEPKQGEWIYCEDASGQDGYKCSECGFFEPWYYDFENHNFITDYAYCPSCGKPMQEGR